ncbi:hypothetical protein F4809DRAFT_431738 [Biscogniauxia mediterranea]|nr:hypothetical protein F4809DRAFT_431738 [Biscogniauxia mediterranea]
MAAGNGVALVASLWTIAMVSGIVLCLRLVAKLIRGRNLWWDDYIMMFSWLLLFVATILMQLAVGLGFGHHSSTLSYDNKFQISTYSVIYSASLTVVVATARISFSCALLRATSGWGKVTAWVVMVGLVCITMVPLVITRFTICVPFQKVYGVAADGYCGNTYIPLYIGWASGAWSAASDFALTILAWKIVWSMSMRRNEKIGVGIALSFGLISGALTVFRYVYVGLIYAQDFFQYGYLGFIWVAAEGATSIIAASIPALRAFVADKSTRSWQQHRSATPSGRSSSSRPNPHRRPRWPLPLRSQHHDHHHLGDRSTTTRASLTRSVPPSPPSSSRHTSHEHDNASGDYHRYRYETDQDIIFSDEWDGELGRRGPTLPLPVLRRPRPRPSPSTASSRKTAAADRGGGGGDDAWAQYFAAVRSSPSPPPPVG